LALACGYCPFADSHRFFSHRCCAGDYLFLAFSPTDTAVLSRRAKLGMMVQSLISFAIIAMLAAWAVNIL
jgi:hypothetical protein